MTARGKLLLLGALYFSQGLPFGFFTQGLPVILRQRGYSLGAIGLSGLLAAPWALKWLWAPFVDRTYGARFGRRKSWIVPLQLLTVALLLGLALVGALSSMRVLLGAILLLNLLAATQDIATDGLAVELLSENERGLGNGLQVAGYRFGMIVGGGALLILHERMGDAGTFAAMALLTLLATLPVLRVHEPSLLSAPTPSVEVAHWLRRPGSLRILLLLVVYKAGDAFATSMLRPFLADSGLTLADIGWLLGTVGFLAGLCGALAGGALLNRVGRKRALLGFGFLQALTVGAYAYLAFAKLHGLALYALCGAEHFASGMATAALFTCMMDWSSEHSSGSDYTVQASAVVIASGVAGAVAGFSAQALGYVGHFGLATLLALSALWVAHRCFP
jgi:MFS transporter, PAT family, beta-lactamase induction signal transducer AmpG